MPRSTKAGHQKKLYEKTNRSRKLENEFNC